MVVYDSCRILPYEESYESDAFGLQLTNVIGKTCESDRIVGEVQIAIEVVNVTVLNVLQGKYLRQR